MLAVVALIALQNFLTGIVGFDPDDGSIGTECPFLSDADARAALGGNADALELSGFFDASIGFIIDRRVLTSSTDCWVTDGEKAYIARVARHDGGDAAAVFAAEREAAAPTSEDQGGGVTLTNEGYFGGEVAGFGDEAFCTGISEAIMAGVLVRQGNRVVYASVGAPLEGDTTVPGMDTTADGVVIAPGLCALAQELARQALK